MSRRFALSVAGWLSLAVFFACGESARVAALKAEPLAAAVDSIAVPFTTPRWLAETSDGVLVLYDLRDGALVRAESGGASVVPVTTRGAGPLEYRRVQRVVRGPGDSLWVLDLPAAKAIVLGDDARPVREQRSPIPTSMTSAMTFGWVRAISSVGDWYASDRAMRLTPHFYVDDSASVVRWRAADGRLDTVARVRLRPVSLVASAAPPRLDVFDPVDAWGVFRDGRVMVVRARDYGIELIDADGRVSNVGRGPGAPLPLTKADAEFTRDSVVRERTELLRSMPVNPLAGAMGVSPGGRPDPALPDPLPSHWPLLRADGIFVDWQDRAWVHVRVAPRDTGASRYDLFDRDGRFLKSISVPAGGIVIGFGRAAVFVAWPDADELRWVKRHPLPQ